MKQTYLAGVAAERNKNEQIVRFVGCEEGS